MLRSALFLVAVAAMVAPTSAAPPDVSGKWLLSTVSPTGESAVAILKVENQNGKPKASVVFSPEGIEISVTDFRVTDSGVVVALKQVRTVQGRPLTSELAFLGVPGKDPKVILGSTGTDKLRSRAKLSATEKTTLEKNEMFVRGTLPEPMQKVQQLNSKVTQASSKMAAEKDLEKRKLLQKDYTDAIREVNEQAPAFYREVVEKHADSPAAFDAALALLRGSTRSPLPADEATKLVQILKDKAMPYGPVFAGVQLAPVADILAAQPGKAELALIAIEPAAKALGEDTPAAIQAAVLATYRTALSKSGKANEAKEIGDRLAKLEAKLDEEYLKAVPPFKPAQFAGRKDKSANQVAVLELFTGAQCPPCVAADVAFDALQKSYKPNDLVLIQYHLHIPGPDPLTNRDTVDRARYYGANSTPSTFFNGTRAAAGGGGMTAAENKYNQYVGVIEPILEKTTPVKLAGKATRNGDKIDIAVEVAGGDAEDMKLRLVLVEENVKYTGSNALRFHHQVVRAMPGGADGVAINDKTFKHTATVDLGDVRNGLTKYLDEYAATRPFPKPDRPMDMKAVRVIALVQNDKTKEIAQAVQIEVEGKAVGGGE